MAKTKTDDAPPSFEEQAEQLQLIDVDDPKLKEVKRELTQYEKLKDANREQHAADHEAEKNKRERVLAAVEAAGVTPASDGAYHFRFGGLEWIIRQDSQLKIKKHAIKEEDGDGDPE